MPVDGGSVSGSLSCEAVLQNVAEKILQLEETNVFQDTGADTKPTYMKIHHISDHATQCLESMEGILIMVTNKAPKKTISPGFSIQHCFPNKSELRRVCFHDFLQYKQKV